MAKRKMKKGGAARRRSAFYGPPKMETQNVFQKLGNEFTNPKSVLRQQFYQDGPIRTKGLDILNKVAMGAKVAGMAVPFLAPISGAINAVNTGAQGADKLARMAGFGRRRKAKSKKAKGSGRKRTRKQRK